VTEIVAENAERHLSAETLVDLSEGLPVDAALRRHLHSCEPCAAQVEELKAALVLARRNLPPEPEPGYWESFLPRVRSRLEKEQTRQRRRLRSTWVAAAAVAALVAGFGIVDLSREPQPGGVAGETTLLPPLAEDEDFQVLVDLAGLLEPEEALESIGPELTPRWDLSSLSVEEQRLLLERLRLALEENPDAKS
jgi:hypothetical protein